jgi:bisphosphoglycerate-independent phosphoglycerate mutase (AlkP superfamily)
VYIQKGRPGSLLKIIDGPSIGERGVGFSKIGHRVVLVSGRIIIQCLVDVVNRQDE